MMFSFTTCWDRVYTNRPEPGFKLPEVPREGKGCKQIGTMRSTLRSRYNRPSLFISFKMLDRWLRVIIWVLSVQSPGAYYILLQRIKSLWTLSGPLFTVMYLKETVRLIHKYVAGVPVYTSQGVCLGISGGLPKLVPGELRTLIRSADPVTIRAVLSVLSVFRIMKVRSTLKLETIVAPFTGACMTMPVWELNRVLKMLPKRFHLKPSSFLALNSAGPNYNPSILGLSLDAFAFTKASEPCEAFMAYATFRQMTFLVMLFV